MCARKIADESAMVKSKERIRDVGEVFTPTVVVEKMLNLFPDDAWGKDKNWLEPTCGNGQFVVAILKRKIAKGFNLYYALATTYGLDIMEDNVRECRQRIYREVVMPYIKGHKAQRLNAICWVRNNFVRTEDTLKEDLNNKFVPFNKLPRAEYDAKRSEIQAVLDMIDNGEKLDMNNELQRELSVFIP